MRYKGGSTPRLTQLLKDLTPHLQKYGRLSALARFCRCHVQAARGWFRLGNGRPPASVALRALRWAEEVSRKPTLRFIPEWESLREWAAAVVRDENADQELADFAATGLQAIQKYLLSEDRSETRPDGEFALGVLEWYCWSRTAYQRHGKMTLLVQKVLNEENSILSARIATVNRPHVLITIDRI